MEVRLVGLHHRQVRGDCTRVRERRVGVPPLGLPPAISLLGGSRARQTWPARDVRSAHAPGLHRLHELVLWPSGEPAPAATAIGGQVPPVAAPPPNADLIRRLLATGLYDDALNELKYAQQVWGTSPAIEATTAWVYHEKGDLRRAITVMRRAYPQFLA